ncbi:MAG: glycosyltransferase [Chitinophagaceae bacterium]
MAPLSKIKNILIAPLDWGLGHATRCIPLIRTLMQTDCQVMAAGEGAVAALLKQEFPRMPILPLEGYRMHYGKSGRNLEGNILRQLPKVWQSIHREYRWLGKAVREYGIDGVISDNRYGLHHPGIPCQLMTHQLRIRTSMGPLGSDLLQSLHYRLIRPFNGCWVPDFADQQNNLAGELSHPFRLPPHTCYLGGLSRFEGIPSISFQYDLMAVISGPEPHRSQLEKLFLNQAVRLPLRTLIVGGLPGSSFDRWISPQVRHISHLPGRQMEEAFLGSAMVITRSGYSTVMDLVKLRKPALLIPTPGQREQEYLGAYLMEKKYFCTLPQEQFDLESALEQLKKFPFSLPPQSMNMESYQSLLINWVNSW